MLNSPGITTVTLDTSVADDLVSALPNDGFEVTIVSVTDRETEGTPFQVQLRRIPQVPETGVWDESRWDHSVWGSGEDSECLDQALAIISNGSFPESAQRRSLSPGQRRQLRDAMILCAHVRQHRDIFVTNDLKGFIKDGRRDKLREAFSTRIMTRDEFVSEFGDNLL